ncbi:MAG TPA: hypothetical protein VMM92_12410, partial [Thermoanaerobaculia bacterium]|nr:hypothetical protein [Thermoanaerobaculia bacterium]
MKSFLAVLSREVAERRLLLYLGFVGIFPLLTPLVASGQGIPDADLRTGSGFLLAGIVGIVLAMGLGATVLGNDLSERRMGFYFARPIPGWAIWGGKLAAAFGLSLATGLLVLLPVLLLEKNARAEFFGEGSGRFAAGVALLACLVLLGNLLSTMLRSRSSWLVLDALAACTVGLLVWYTCRRLLQAELASAPVLGLLPSRPLFRGLTGLVPVAIVAALLGSAAQILHGRTDLRRGHRLLSLIFWGLLLAGSLGFVGYGQWVLAATPADLTAILGVIAAPAGSTVAVQGRAAHRTGYAPQFLLDTASGRFTRILSRSKVYFSQDGRRAAWLQAQDLSGSAPAGLVELDLARPEASPHPTPLTYAATAVGALSPDGRQFATVRRGRLTVEEIGPGRLLAAVPVGAGFDWRSQ